MELGIVALGPDQRKMDQDRLDGVPAMCGTVLDRMFRKRELTDRLKGGRLPGFGMDVRQYGTFEARLSHE